MDVLSVEFYLRNLIVTKQPSSRLSNLDQDDKKEETEKFLHDVIRLMKLSGGTQKLQFNENKS